MTEQEAQRVSSQNAPSISAPWWVRLCRVLWKGIAFIGTILVLGSVASIIATWATTSKGQIAADSPLGRVLAQWPVALPVGGCLLLIALLIWVLSRWPIHQNASLDEQIQGTAQSLDQQTSSARPAPLLSSIDRQNRLRLLKRVHAIWIEGVLEDSLHQAAMIALDLQDQPDALKNPWRYVVQETNLPRKPLPTGTSITQIYQEADGALLIMGEPGAGKSTLLLELTRTLHEQTVQNEQLPIPVVFNLSTWAQKRRELSEWLVEELWLRYDVSRSIGKVWVEADRILPLLDGLDEVEESSRPACVQAINSYSQQHLGRPLVTCCRTAEYYAQATRVRLNKAVEVQPLTNQQVAQYLDSAGGKLEGVRMLIKRDAEIRELARTPLMLSILALTNYDTMPKLPGTGSLEMRRRQIFATYVQQMLSRRGRLKSGSAQQIMYWLTWLAGQMKRHQPPLSEFYLEQLQSDWLPDQNIQAWYRRSLVLVFGLGGGLLFGLGGGLLFGPANGLITSLISGLVSWRFFGRDAEIRPTEVITWVRENRRSYSALLLFITLPFLLLFFLAFRLFYGVAVALVVGLSFWLLIFLIVISQGIKVDARARAIPNQGIRLSARNGLIFGLIACLVVGLIDGLKIGLGYGPLGGLISGLGSGLFFGLAGGLDAFIKHFILRFWLWHSEHLPWDLVAFLNEAVQRLLLRKVGGRYIFVHRLLLEYFASLEKKES